MTDIFDDKSTTTNEDVVLVVGDRQYTKEDLQNKIVNADSHIEKIESENADMRKKIDEYMEVLSKLKDTPTTSEPKTDTPNTKGLTPEEVAEIVEQQLKTRSTVETQQNNLLDVNQKLVTKFGSVEAAKQAFTDKAKELGMSFDKFKELASESPAAVMQFFNTQTSTTNSTTTTHNTNAVSANSGAAEEGTWTWWQEKRKNNPDWYYSPKATRQRMVDAERLGRDKFFN